MKLNAKLVETAPAVIAVKTDGEGDDKD
jgi:hypothetical protein